MHFQIGAEFVSLCTPVTGGDSPVQCMYTHTVQVVLHSMYSCSLFSFLPAHTQEYACSSSIFFVQRDLKIEAVCVDGSLVKHVLDAPHGKMYMHLYVYVYDHACLHVHLLLFIYFIYYYSFIIIVSRRVCAFAIFVLCVHV